MKVLVKQVFINIILKVVNELEKYFITIISFNPKHNTFDEQQFTEDTKAEISRILITFKPKKGYHMTNAIIDIFRENEEMNKHHDQLKLNI